MVSFERETNLSIVKYFLNLLHLLHAKDANKRIKIYFTQ